MNRRKKTLVSSIFKNSTPDICREVENLIKKTSYNYNFDLHLSMHTAISIEETIISTIRELIFKQGWSNVEINYAMNHFEARLLADRKLSREEYNILYENHPETIPEHKEKVWNHIESCPILRKE